MAESNPAVTGNPNYQSQGKVRDYSHPRINQFGNIQQLKLLNARYTDNLTSEYILQQGHVFYFSYPGIVSTSYGMCSIFQTKGNYYICKFDNPKAIVTLDKNDKHYVFYSEPIPENKKLIKPDLKNTFSTPDTYLIEQLLQRDWQSHSNTPFESISAFFHELISSSANPTVLMKIIYSNHM
ncbi:hypothetical protein LOD99_14497 [Oopsacas minuta]|uniref:Uncharacterized protein n=1 Tax=Oopsacas minuta TaxID=111878 RepID=A0AAV7KG80_9METZ|nr:hypothetical protein LOD99_14497 [Oopsacas minuta]